MANQFYKLQSSHPIQINIATEIYIRPFSTRANCLLLDTFCAFCGIKHNGLNLLLSLFNCNRTEQESGHDGLYLAKYVGL